MVLTGMQYLSPLGRRQWIWKKASRYRECFAFRVKICAYMYSTSTLQGQWLSSCLLSFVIAGLRAISVRPFW